MPIRLLAFDNHGTNIELIERSTIFSRVLTVVFTRTSKPDFQSAWAQAETLEEFDVVVQSSRVRHNKMKKLLEEAVKESVDYAILSHTWIRHMPGEIAFQDWDMREDNLEGNSKIVNFCEAAAQRHNVTLGWIDTVCINKESSSELDESIRSMYNWYRNASVCITYLSETTNISDAHHDSWFTRGWTLQELLAPMKNAFYDKHWDQLGLSTNPGIQSTIEQACGITRKELDLSRSGNIAKIPISRRMQMACGRQVTREEDLSYSLMGILGVDISIAYGEGASRAFSRLVRELFNTKKNVLDIFNRSYNDGDSLLPSSVESYQHRLAQWDVPDGGTSLDKYQPLDPIIITHLGVRIPLLLAPGLVVKRVAEEWDYPPKGALSAKVPSTALSRKTGKKVPLDTLLCDNRLYTGGLTNLGTADAVMLPEGVPHIHMLGIINFGIDNKDYILLSEQCFPLSLNWSGLQEGNFTPSGTVMINSGVPLHFCLKSTIGFKIHKAELENHGMQLISLYL